MKLLDRMASETIYLRDKTLPKDSGGVCLGFRRKGFTRCFELLDLLLPSRRAKVVTAGSVCRLQHLYCRVEFSPLNEARFLEASRFLGLKFCVIVLRTQ